MPAQECIWLKNGKGLFPELSTTSEQNKAETVMAGQERSFDLSMEDDQLLAKQGILNN